MPEGKYSTSDDWVKRLINWGKLIGIGIAVASFLYGTYHNLQDRLNKSEAAGVNALAQAESSAKEVVEIKRQLREEQDARKELEYRIRTLEGRNRGYYPRGAGSRDDADGRPR